MLEPTPIADPRRHHRSLEPGALVAIGVGGMAGSAARVGLEWSLPVAEGVFPLSILVVNLVGSLVVGWFLAFHDRRGLGGRSLQFWAIGVFGSLTTLSGFSVAVFELLSSGAMKTALAFIAASLVGGFGVFLAGHRLGSR
jgi:fluoride exporter